MGCVFDQYNIEEVGPETPPYTTSSISVRRLSVTIFAFSLLFVPSVLILVLVLVLCFPVVVATIFDSTVSFSVLLLLSEDDDSYDYEHHRDDTFQHHPGYAP